MTSSTPPTTCVIHFEGVEEILTSFTECTYNKFLERRDEWRSVLDATRKIAVKSFDHLPEGLDFLSLEVQEASFHYTCYRRFTDKSKLERARKRKAKYMDISNHKLSESEFVVPEVSKVNTRSSSSLVVETDQNERRCKDVLPHICIICQKNTLYVNDKVSTGFIQISYISNAFMGASP